eukprot:CAMPEP_0184540736 /NCGR_PEP_ID=MMETSP0199_2-20130426/892_1 /TAXON_ID=1112570 /ORGANISM="Thraustochytrium sp., Strain LLF1b" /LENGTH=931 /DNA_ID=CAMNT_0026934383 /DNA_START=56 /DNA_END=2852 /DNA_ORIENTATION=+
MARLDTDPLRWLVPNKYTIDYSRLDLEACEFEGQVKISVATNDKAPSAKVVLHSKELEVITATLQGAQGTDPTSAESISIDAKAETVTLCFPEAAALTETQAITLTFKGKLTDSLAGLYRSYYTTAAGVKRCMAVTQFEATDARRAFPCFDEPNLKASFELSVVAPADRVCLSNTPVVYSATDLAAGTKLWQFGETPVMSTYLLALVCGDLDVVTAYSSRGVLTSVYTRPGSAQDGRFALDCACRALDFYEREYAINYPLQKQDLAGLADFAAGAMENWGLVTYREQRLLVNESTSEAAKFSVARVVAHENAHMWFGNLVTMEYWTDLWLNEGFARFMEFNCVNHMFPEWDAWTVFVKDVQSLALKLDSMMSTHPVRVEVETPDQISEIFDAISYAKGASIIRMLEAFLGHEKFMKGVQFYLKKFAFQNAVTDDLWASIEEANGEEPHSIQNMMSTWTGREGYPVIKATETVEGEVSLASERFHFNSTAKNAGSAEIDQANWTIPLTMLSGSASESKQVVVADQAALDTVASELTQLARADQWFTLNAGVTGFYRVCYSGPQWSRLEKAMTARTDSAADVPSADPDTLKLCADDRIGIVRDAFACASSGILSAVVPLRLCLALMPNVEKNPLVLLEATNTIAAMADMYRDEDFFSTYAEKVLLASLEPIMEELTWEPRKEKTENMHVAALRAAVLKALAKAPVTENTQNKVSITSKALDLTRAHLAGESMIAPDLRLAVFQLAAKNKDAASELFKAFQERLEAPGLSPEERSELLTTIASFSQHSELLEDTVKFAMTSVRNQDFALVVTSLAGASYSGAKHMWNMLTSDYDMFWDKYSQISFQWGRIVLGIVSALRTNEDLDQVVSFFENREVGSASRSLKSALEMVQSKIDRLGRERDEVRAFLNSDAFRATTGCKAKGVDDYSFLHLAY